jgi:hypothetical protein
MPDIQEQMTAQAEFEAAAQARRDQVLGPVEDGWVQWWEVDPEVPKQRMTRPATQ